MRPPPDSLRFNSGTKTRLSDRLVQKHRPCSASHAPSFFLARMLSEKLSVRQRRLSPRRFAILRISRSIDAK